VFIGVDSVPVRARNAEAVLEASDRPNSSATPLPAAPCPSSSLALTATRPPTTGGKSRVLTNRALKEVTL
jgi:hypothetical protein